MDVFKINDDDDESLKKVINLLTETIWSLTWILPSRAAALPSAMLCTNIPDKSSEKNKIITKIDNINNYS